MSVAGLRQSLLLWSVDYWNLEGITHYPLSFNYGFTFHFYYFTKFPMQILEPN